MNKWTDLFNFSHDSAPFLVLVSDVVRVTLQGLAKLAPYVFSLALIANIIE